MHVITGCAHAGPVNTLLQVQRIGHFKQIHGLVGGTHLIGRSEEYVQQTVKELERFRLSLFSPCHCTGFKAMARLWQTFPDIFVLNFCGRVIEAVSKPGVFSQFFYEGTYSRMDQLFHEGWTQIVRKKLDISKGLFFSIFLADLYESIQNMKNVDCFENVVKKLSNVDDDFLPTVFEVELSCQLLDILKEAIEEAEFEGCFKTRANKEPDFRIKVRGNWVYFEMTKVMDYQKCDVVLRLYNLLSAFLIGIRLKTDRRLQMKLCFKSIPDQSAINNVIEHISERLSRGDFNTSETLGSFSFSIEEVPDDPMLKLSIPSRIELNKLKDKYFEELEHFDEDEINIIAIDTTYLPGEPEKYMAATEQIFKTEPELSPITALVYVTKEHFVKPNGIPIETLTKCMIKYNKNCAKEKVDFLWNVFASK